MRLNHETDSRNELGVVGNSRVADRGAAPTTNPAHQRSRQTGLPTWNPKISMEISFPPAYILSINSWDHARNSK
ncbi:hypothetical protein L484_014672 [Morus notabilis]|uniref:Uncharacterized protein n=1 Tax=Morus notabilis TaxID=981085 RepID=W9SB74_9ROSA|nr:hypothetical protein L484_014672 [Morus notabilis]